MAAIRASRTLARDTAISAGSPVPALSSASGMGCSHGTSGCAAGSGPAGSSPGALRPDGSGRRARVSSARRHVLVAILYNQVRSEERPSNSP